MLDSAVDLATEVLCAERASGGEVCAIGVSTMGLTRADHVDLAPNVPGGEPGDPRCDRGCLSSSAAAFGNDVKLAALAELTWGALVGVDYGVYLNLGTGIAATMVVAGEVVEGAHGAAGEIGHWLTDGSATPRMAADGAVPTEEALGGRGVARQSAALYGRPVEVAELVTLAGADKSAEMLLATLWDKVATLVANLAIVYDPEVLVLGGGYVRSDRFPIDAIARLVECGAYSPAVVRARFEGYASLHGAVAVALRDRLRAASTATGTDQVPSRRGTAEPFGSCREKDLPERNCATSPPALRRTRFYRKHAISKRQVPKEGER